MVVDQKNFAFFVLVCFLLLYGATLEPTPDTASLELLLFFSLSLVLTVVCARSLLAAGSKLTPIYGILVVGLFSAVFQNASEIQIARDLVSFLFLPFSFIVLTYVTSDLERLEKLRLVIAITGVLFSLRYAKDAPSGIQMIISSSFRLDKEYLSSEPMVMFSLLFFLQLAFSQNRLWVRVSALGMSVLASSGLLAAGFRGPIIVWALMFIIYAALSVARGKMTGRTFSLLLACASIFAAVQLGILSQIAAKIISKTAAVGANGKLAEFLFIVGLDRPPFELLFGVGFGGNFPSPIFPGAKVAYTHNIFTYFYMKFGLIGLSLFFWLIWRRIVKYLILRPSLIVSHLPEILTLSYIGLGQASYKHFGFSLLLGILMTCSSIRLPDDEKPKPFT